jgi:nucleoside 2-deoxyribosyltransferase
MENVSKEYAEGWRAEATTILERDGWKTLNPCRRTHSFQVKEFKKIFELDLRDIQESDIILVNLCDPKIAKNGTAMEVFYANYILRKPVIAFKDDPTVKHPFFEQLVTEWASNAVDAAWKIVKEYA